MISSQIVNRHVMVDKFSQVLYSAKSLCLCKSQWEFWIFLTIYWKFLEKSINTCNLDSSESHEIWNQRNCTLSDIVSKLLKRQTYSFFSKFLDIYRIFMDEIMIIWWQLYSTILTFYFYMHIRRYGVI